MGGAAETEGQRRTPLVITYRWPPQGGGGVQRTLKFVKYLTKRGWHPVVHTVRNPYSTLWDPGLGAEVPAEVPVYRTPTFEFESAEAGLAEMARRAAGLLRGKRDKASGGAASGAVKATPATAEDDGAGMSEREARRARGGALARAQDYVWSRFLVPDPQIVWLPGAYWRSLQIARRHRPDVLFTTAPPQSLNLLGMRLQAALQLPWVADLRDPWTDGVHRNQWYPDNPGRKAREERWERAIFERADHVIVVTESARDGFLVKYPWCAPDKISVITNGFDPVDFAHVSPQRRFLEPGKLHVTLTGHVETLFDLVPFFSAVDEVARDPRQRGALRINLIGTRRQPRYDEWIEAHGLGDVIRYHKYVPHADSVQILTESDVLMLCMTPRHDYGAVKILGKMCEYLYTRKPVLALTIPGITSRILESAGVGVTIDPGDVAGMAAALRRFLAEQGAGGIRVAPNEAVIARFDREQQAGALAAILARAMAARGAR